MKVTAAVAGGVNSAAGFLRLLSLRRLRNCQRYLARPQYFVGTLPLLRLARALRQAWKRIRVCEAIIDALDDDSPSMRVLSIHALETLNAREALPRLISLLDDHRKSHFGAQVSVADAAKAAIAKLQ